VLSHSSLLGLFDQAVSSQTPHLLYLRNLSK